MAMIKLIYATYKAVKSAKGVVTAPSSIVKKLIRDFAIKKIISVVVEDVIKAEQKDVEFLNKKYSFVLPSYLEKIGKDELVNFLEEIFNDGLTFSGDITGYNAGDIKIKLVANPAAKATPTSKVVEIDLKLGLMKEAKEVIKSPLPSIEPISSASPVALKKVGHIGSALEVKVELEPISSSLTAEKVKVVSTKSKVKKVTVSTGKAVIKDNLKEKVIAKSKPSAPKKPSTKSAQVNKLK